MVFYKNSYFVNKNEVNYGLITEFLIINTTPKKLFFIAAFFLVAYGKVYASSEMTARGEYIVRVAGCNDCHTPGYAEKGGNIPTNQWLIGAPVGYKGPWGVTYPANLRLLIPNLTEDQWVNFAKNLQARPPMPWFTLRMISEPDLRAVYQFIKSLGPAGAQSPNFVPPGGEIKTKYIDFVPVSAQHWSGFSHVSPK
jgi:mono/diheme cytochrome c family protein